MASALKQNTLITVNNNRYKVIELLAEGKYFVFLNIRGIWTGL